MRRLALASVLLLCVLGAPRPAEAQNCRLSGNPNIVGQGDFLFLGGRFRLDCPGGVVIQADSAVNIQSIEELYLIGDVSFQDTVKALDADWAHYQSRDRYLSARGEVLVTDLDTRSTVRGTQLQYWREGPARPEARVLVEGNRPHAVIYSRPEPGQPPASDTAPTIIDADIVELLGQTRFRGQGNVEITRGEVRGFGTEATFDELANRLELAGNARVDGEAYDLEATRIDAHLTEDNKLERVFAYGRAELISAEANIEAPELRVFFADGVARRLIALGTERASPLVTTGDTTQALIFARAENFRLVGDSVDALAQGERIDSLYAVGRAYAEQLQDTALAALPEVVRSDWARGDTIRAYFALADSALAEPVAGQDSVAQRVVLERMLVLGAGDDRPAQTLYREASRDDPTGPPQINYMVAKSIVIQLENGEVRLVTAEGPVKGLQLQPNAPPPADTTGQPVGGRR